MSSWGIRAKILLILGIFISAGAISTYLGIDRIGLLKNSMDKVVNKNVVILQNSQKLESLYHIQLINEKNFILSNDREELATHKDYMTERAQEIKVTIENILAADPGASTREDLKEFEKHNLEWVMLMDQIESLKRQEQNAEAIKLTQTQGRDLRLKVNALLDQIIKRNLEIMQSDTKSANELYANARNLILFVSIACLILGLAFTAMLILSTKDRIHSSLRRLTANSTELVKTSSQIKESSHDISSASTEQAASIQETASAIEELNTMVKKNADNSKEAADMALQSSSSAEKGKQVVQTMISAIDDINHSNERMVESINESNDQISDIVKVIAEIGGKTKVINDIVFQTKLLAFNASVEAARAGEHGKGFAVVAEEVGSLAEMSGKASKEISTLLESSINKVQAIVDQTKANIGTLVSESNNKVQVGTQVANQCGEVLSDIVNKIQVVLSMVNEISTASQEQSLGVSEITKAMNTLDEATQSNSTVALQSSSTAQIINDQARDLQEIYNTLVTTLEGANSDFLKNSPAPSNVVKKPIILKKEDIKISKEIKAEVKLERKDDMKNVIPLEKSVLNKEVISPRNESVDWVSLDDNEEDDDFQVI